jgi:hypothetical protein
LVLSALRDACQVQTPRERLEAPNGFKERLAKTLRRGLLGPSPEGKLWLVLTKKRESLKDSIDDIMLESEISESDTMMAWRTSIIGHIADVNGSVPFESGLLT